MLCNQVNFTWAPPYTHTLTHSQEPPAEEANLVEKILSHRVRETKTDEEKEKYGEKMEEFLVKYKN